MAKKLNLQNSYKKALVDNQDYKWLIMNRREALKATVGIVGLGTLGTGLVQANQTVGQYHWEWKFVEDSLSTFRGWQLYLNGYQVEWLCEDFTKYDADTVEKMKQATQQEVYWRLEKRKLRDGSYPHWFYRNDRSDATGQPLSQFGPPRGATRR